MKNELADLTRAFADGTISESGLRQLEAILQRDPAAREEYLREMNLIDALEERSAAEQAPGENPKATVQADSRPFPGPLPGLRWSSLAVLAASLLVLASLAWSGPGHPAIGTVSELQGTVRWTGQDGIVVDRLATGDSLPGGTLTVLSADSWVTFRFDDGSEVTLSGEAEAVLSDRNQKQVHLGKGRFSAEIQPQPAGFPMIVRTPAAEIQVLGTQFNLTAGATETGLAVNQGQVRIRRTSDGKVLDVPAGHQATASLDLAEEFAVQRRGPDLTVWQSDLENDRDVMHGYWKPALYELGIKLKQAVTSGELSEAEALARYKTAVRLNNQGSVRAKPSAIGCLVWLNVNAGDQSQLLLTGQSRIRITGRLRDSGGLETGISTGTAGGGFSGKYRCKISAEKLNRSAGGDFQWVIDVADLLPQGDGTPIGTLAHDWWCVADSNTAGLEIFRVEILEP